MKYTDDPRILLQPYLTTVLKLMLYLNGIVSKPCPLRDPLTLPLACWWPFLVRIFKPESDWKVFGREVWRGVWQIHTRFKRSWLHIINRLMKNSVNSLAPSWLMVYVSMGWGWGVRVMYVRVSKLKSCTILRKFWKILLEMCIFFLFSP